MTPEEPKPEEPKKEPKKARSKDELLIATAIAVVCAFALVVFAARQTPVAGRDGRGLSRAQINNAEERAIWAEPKGTASSGRATVTMTGCVEKHGDSFRLTDTEGDDAPRSRSWKFGFFRRGNVPLELVDGAQTAPFKHVGERVRVTGTLDDRELTLRSLRRVADSCS
jgi:hypothetical protein